ncbi:MAG: hypothetical protein ACKPKO_54260, partial [Candidatus Fonsibacter sp.]
PPQRSPFKGGKAKDSETPLSGASARARARARATPENQNTTVFVVPTCTRPIQHTVGYAAIY